MQERNDPYREMFEHNKSVQRQYLDFRRDCPQFDPGEDYLVVIDDDSSNVHEIVGAFGRDNFDVDNDQYRGVMEYALDERLPCYPPLPHQKFNVGVLEAGMSRSWILPW